MHFPHANSRLLSLALQSSMRLVIGALCVFAFASSVQADWKLDIDYFKLVDALGGNLPNGAGVPISIVEAGGNPPIVYFPDTSSTEFDSSLDPLGTAVNFVDGSGGQANGVSNHSNNQSAFFFGNFNSISPAANNVTVYEAGDYLNNVLKINGGSPLTQNFRVQNFSWIASFGTDSTDREALRRFDSVIDSDNIVAVVGLDNNTNPLPILLSHSYNSIAMGRSDALHSSGLTTLAGYGPGRSKPDLVAPRPSTSSAASTTSSVATFLHSSPTVVGTDATNSEAIKALLLAGATKDEFPGWSRTQNQPLDDTYGAGEVNVYNSYLMTLGGQFAGSTGTPTPVDNHGWDYRTVTSSSPLNYEFEIPLGSTAQELSIALTWNVDVNPSFTTQSLAKLDLKLFDEMGAVVDQSISTVDNVEHIYIGAGQGVSSLAPGTYRLEVSTADFSRDFGLAWRTTTLFDTPSADFNLDGEVDGVDFLTWQRGFGALLGATHSQGDADGDGDIDQDDLTILETDYGLFTAALDNLAVAVPEPGTWALVVSALLLFLFIKQPRRAGTLS